ncbi:MAG: site-specific integrase [Deltaproteobacteria bacterium]|nr:site-specific integrase [Deltaproteobacteria bacterium]
MTIREYTSKKTGKPTYTAYVRKKGRISTRTFTSESKAKEWASSEGKRLLREALLSTAAPGGGGHYRLSKAIEGFRAEKLPELSQSWASYLKWLNENLGDIRLRDLTLEVITEARDEYMGHREGNPKTQHLPTLKPASGNKLTTAIKMLVNYAMEKRWITDSPMGRWKRLSEDQYARERWLDDDERNLLLEAADKSKSIPLVTVILVALYSGYRKEVIRTLTWKSIDFEANVINVPQKYSQKGKPGKPRAFALPIVPELREVLLRHEAMLKKVGVRHISPFVFPSPTDANLPWDFSRPFETAVRKAGLVDFHFHDLRHTAATYLARANVSVHVIQRFLGHRSARVTQRYIKMPEKFMQSEMCKGFAGIINKAPHLDITKIFDEEN